MGVATASDRRRMFAATVRGTVSYVCPLARAVLTYAPGETVEIAGEEAVILEIR